MELLKRSHEQENFFGKLETDDGFDCSAGKLHTMQVVRNNQNIFIFYVQTLINSMDFAQIIAICFNYLDPDLQIHVIKAFVCILGNMRVKRPECMCCMHTLGYAI